MARVQIEMIAEVRKMSQGINDVNGKLGNLGKSANKAANLMKSAFVVAGAAMIGSKVVGFLGDCVEQARESNKVMAQTQAVLKSTGGQAGITAKQVSDLATALSLKTGVDDEVIQSGENVLLTFTNIRNEAGKGNDIFNQTVGIANDLSAALGQSMKSSAIQLGKALNDPTKGVTALSRVGVSFTAQQKEQIKTLQASGKTLAAQKIIMGEVKKEFGGSAAAIATPGQKLAVVVGNIKENIGNALIPILDKLATYLTKNLPQWIQKAQDAFNHMKDDFLNNFGPAIDQVRTALGNVQPIFKKIINFIKENPEVVEAFAGTLIVLAAAIGVATVAAALFTAVLDANPISIVVLALAALAAGFVYAYKHSEKFRIAVAIAMDVVKVAFTVFWAVAKPIFKLWGAELKVIAALARWLWNNAFQPAFKLILGIMATLMHVWAKMLGALGHVPGFGWAKDASKTMEDAANKASQLASNIRNIPSGKDVTVTLNYINGIGHTTGGRVLTGDGGPTKSPSSRNYTISVTAPLIAPMGYDAGEQIVSAIREFEAAGGTA